MNEDEEFEFRARMEQEAAASPSPVVSTEQPSYLSVAGNAAAKGVAGMIDMFGNAPTNAFNLGQGVIGATAEALGHPEVWADRTFGTPPNLGQKGLTALGLIKPENEPQTPGQRILDMAVQTGVSVAASPAAGVAGVARNLGVGLASGAAAGATKEATGSDLAATAVGIAVPLLVHAVVSSKANAPILKNPVKLKTAKAGMKAGLVVPPSEIKPSFTTNRIEGIGGKAATRQAAASKNQAVVNELMAEEIGLPKNTIFDDDILDAVVDRASGVYREISAVSPRASSALNNLKQTRFDANEQWKYYRKSGNPEAGAKARSLSARAEMYERVIDREANRIIDVYGVKQNAQASVEPVQGTIVRSPGLSGPTAVEQTGLPPGRPPVSQLETREVGFPAVDLAGNASKSKAVGFATPSTEQSPLLSREVGFAVPGAPRQAGEPSRGAMPRAVQSPADIEMELLTRRTAGRPTLLQELREARTLIAKTHDIRKALGLGDGNVNPQKFAQMLRDRKPLTGNFLLVGKFAQAFPSVMREGSRIPSSGVSGTEAGMSAILGMGGAAAAGPMGLIAGGLPLLRSPARSMLLSKGYQNRLLKSPPVLNQAMLKSVLGGRAIAEAP